MDFLNSLLDSFIKISLGIFLLINSAFTFLDEQYAARYSSPVQTQMSTATTTPTTATTTPPLVHATSSDTTTVKETTVPKQSIPPIIVTATPKTTITVDLETLNTQARQAVVNVLCTTQSSGLIHPISASGVMIDTRGVVLTNAHVGQFFLLRDYPTAGNVDCVIRTGSPAQPVYRATLLYLPPAWIDENASQLKAEQAVGTGEGDYAFLLITESINPSTPLPSFFPALPMSASDPDENTGVLLTAYPAGFLDGSSIQKSLYATSAFTSVQKLYTFDDTKKVDLISVRGTVVSQGGSSGGAVVRTDDGKLAGIIVTDTEAATTAQRDLRAITISYINRDLSLLGKGGIVGFLLQDLNSVAATFAATTAVLEKKKLIDALTAH